MIHHAANRGHIATYNEGLLEWARGDYLMLLSADDEMAAGSLARSVSLMEQHPRMGMVYGRSVILSDDGRPSGPPGRFRGYSVWPGPKWLADRCREGVNVVPNPGVLVRGAFTERLGATTPPCLTRVTWRCGFASLPSLISATSAVLYRPGTGCIRRA